MAHNKENQDPSENENRLANQSAETCASVNAGICGFTCWIRAWKKGQRAVGLAVSESECQQIQAFSDIVKSLTLKEVFTPATRNPVYLAAEQSGCHASCPVPVAVLKAAEVAMEMALARDVSIRFETCKGEEI